MAPNIHGTLYTFPWTTISKLSAFIVCLFLADSLKLSDPYDPQNRSKSSKFGGVSLKEGLVEGLQEIDGGVTVHHACHARAQNMGNKARDMLKLIPNIKIDVVERCAGHGGTFGIMKDTHNLALKVGRPTARQIKNKNNKYMASDCPLAGKHLKQLEVDTKILNDEALHPIELIAKSYRL